MIFALSTKRKLWNPEIRISYLNGDDFENKPWKKKFFLFFLFFLFVIFTFFSKELFFTDSIVENQTIKEIPKDKEKESTKTYSAFSRSIFPYSESIKSNFEKMNNKNIFKPLIWRGQEEEGSILFPEKIIQCINEVEEIFEYTIPKNLRLLIIETMAIESHFGRVIGRSDKSPQGVLQITPSTHKYVIEDLSRKEKYIKFYAALQRVTDPALSPEKNLRYNVHYGIVFFLWYMEHRKGILAIESSEKPPLLNSISRRWKIYKSGWNTYHPAATATKTFYVTRAKEVSELLTTVNFH